MCFIGTIQTKNCILLVTFSVKALIPKPISFKMGRRWILVNGGVVVGGLADVVVAEV
jgi:hypothetical protein